MALKTFCTTLQACAEKLEQEIKFNINEFNNQIFGHTMDETKLALERAKDYHYKEIVDAIGEIMKNIKIVIFHQEKIDYINENNITANDMKRFSYVKRQIYNFSRSEENLAKPTTREKRRTASTLSVGSLEAWEKYLDQKETEDLTHFKENVAEAQMVPRRTHTNARARKKFVSSTLGGFLEDEEVAKSLDSICEDDFVEMIENIEDKMANEQEVMNEIIGNFERIQEEAKPKIVDVVMKKKPT